MFAWRVCLRRLGRMASRPDRRAAGHWPRRAAGFVFQVAGEIRRANEALLPYGLAKVTPDQGGGAPVTFINLPAPVTQGAPGDGARVIEGEARTVAASVYAPPPMPSQPQRNQEVSDDEDEGSDK